MLLALGRRCVLTPLRIPGHNYLTNICTKVAVDRTKPNGRVLGVDIIPAQPPRGVSTIQGNFLSAEVQKYVQGFLCDPRRGRPYEDGYIMPGRGSEDFSQHALDIEAGNPGANRESDSELKTVDVVLSDMSAPWPQINGFWKRSLSEPYHRMMNTSGVSFKDHAGSMVRVFRKNSVNLYSTLTIKLAVRIYVMLHYNSVTTSSRLVGVLSANSTKEPKIRNSKSSSENCFEESID